MELGKVVVMEQVKVGTEKVETGLEMTHFGQVKVGMEKVEMGLEMTHYGNLKNKLIK